ncbi:hypothetical protein [Thiospirillum jenense]|uniref:Uncharacterized protein n=1 Tax=Thiospirillum jenense TaxID=1653858 RepID=A0A839HJI3_9GAMM|nr:hypothetical protein [Thiospirillum jenense]MBB1126132.1 hypothetical protein [Thiospirillum jenense]
MSTSELNYSNEPRECLQTARYFSSSQYYFFELKRAKNGSKYIIVDQRRRRDGEFSGVKLRIFENELSEFQRILTQLIKLAKQQDVAPVTTIAPAEYPPEAIYKDRYFTSSHHYFFELKQAKTANYYIVIEQTKKPGYDSLCKLRIFDDEFSGVKQIIDQLIASVINDNGLQTTASQQLTIPTAGVTPLLDTSVLIPNSINNANPLPIALSISPRLVPSQIFKSIWQRLRRTSSQQHIDLIAASVRHDNQQRQVSTLPSQLDLTPPFFEHLLTTHNWQQFEQYTTYLLKLLGILVVYPFFAERQAGKADGFFKTQTLVVLYDCTLRADHIESDKRDQINNYCSQLKQGAIELSPHIKEEFFHHQQQVWIITQHDTQYVKMVNTINVKAVSVATLQALYYQRLTGYMTVTEFEEKLRNLP